MRILFVFTGGTIGSTTHGESITPDAKKPYTLLEAYHARYASVFAYDAVSPYTALSENNTGESLSLLCDCVASHLHAGYDGIVVTHGTDTLQYSAAALSYAFADTPVPILLVSASHPLEHEDSNALENLHGALCFIAQEREPGVFVSYQNKGEAVRIHRGARLLESMACSDLVKSMRGMDVGAFNASWRFCKNEGGRALPDALPALGVPILAAECAEILRIWPYPGIRYPALDARVRYVLHGSFHSGTINTVSKEAQRFFTEARERGIPVFLTGVERGPAYASVAAFSQLGVQPLYDLAPIAAFVKLWMLHTKDPTRCVCAETLQASLGGDILPE